MVAIAPQRLRADSGAASESVGAELLPGQPTINPAWRRTGMAGGAMFLVYLLWQVGRWGGIAHQALIGDLWYLPLCVLAIGATLGAARRCRATPRLARAWRLLAVAYGCSLIGQFFQAYEEIFRHHLQYPSLADAGFLSFYGFFFAGLIGFARSARSNTRRVMFGLDIATVALGGSAVLWYFEAGPSVLAGGQPWLEVVLAVAYPLGDLVLLLGAAATLMGGLNASRRSLTILTGGVGLYVLGDLVWSQIVLHGTYRGGDPVDTTWIGAIILFALAGALQPTTEPVNPHTAAPNASRRPSRLPFLGLIATFTLLIIVDRHDPLFPKLSITAIAVAVACVVGTRQVLAQRALTSAQARSVELMGQLHYQAFHDPLTGLANRSLFHERLDHALSRRPALDHYQAVLMIDLDGFKAVNDRYGHDVGDQLLVAVADRLKTSVRAADTVARLGGDEFVILAEQLCDSASATRIGEHVLDALSRPLSISGHAINPKASIGIAITTGNLWTPEALLQAADRSLYQAKDQGRGRICLSPGRAT